MREKIVVFTGAGVSAESGLKTFRDMGGYWREYAIEEVASPEGFRKNPAAVLRFYNERRRAVLEARPNAAHFAIASLEEQFEVVVVTQNVDDLHERAGSSNIIHVHGEILKARSSADPSRVYPLTSATIEIGERCELGSQLRPDVVWFGEQVRHLEEAARHFTTASKILTVGTSLTVHPAAGLVELPTTASEKYLVAPEAERIPHGYRFLRGTAVTIVPSVVQCWKEGLPVSESST